MKIKLTEENLKNIIRSTLHEVLKESYADTHMGSNPFMYNTNREVYGGNNIGDVDNNNSSIIGDRNINTIGDLVWALENWFKPYAEGSRLTTIDNAINMFSGMNQNYKIKYYNAIQEGKIGNFFSGLGKKINNTAHNILGIDTDEQVFDKYNYREATKMPLRCKKIQRVIKSMYYKYKELGHKYNKYQGLLRQLYNVIGSMKEEINPYRMKSNWDDEWATTGSADSAKYNELGSKYAQRSQLAANTRKNNIETSKARKEKRQQASSKGWDTRRKNLKNNTIKMVG